MTHTELKQFSDRQDLAAGLRALFPYLLEDINVSPIRGGREAALKTLGQITPELYASTRNHVSGNVTRLSAYLRHGVLTLAEVRDNALGRVSEPSHAGKFINELGWRDYWQRLYMELGEAIWEDQEVYKTGFAAEDYAATLPDEIAAQETSLVCIDTFSKDLQEIGYLHNHVRLWFAAYIVHWRRVRWQAGAQWFLEHLIDGDPASNNLSWQWVASTFASSPYIFNRENLERYTEGLYCSKCPHATARTCPFENTYEALEQTLFPMLPYQVNAAGPSPKHPYVKPEEVPPPAAQQGKPLLWHHTDSLNPSSPVVTLHAGAPAAFIWDTGWLVPNRISLKRVLFIAECLREMPGDLDIRVGEPAEQLLAAAQSAGADYILAQRTPDPRLIAAASHAAQHLPVVWFDPPPFVSISRGFDLKRFSRYWKRAQKSALQPTQLP